MERLIVLKIGQRAAEPAFGHVKLAAILGRFLDRLLGLLFGADEQHVCRPCGRRRGENRTPFPIA